MNLRECLEHVAFSVRDDTSESISKIKEYIFQTTDDDDSFYLLDEIIQDIVEANPHTKQVAWLLKLLHDPQSKIRIRDIAPMDRSNHRYFYLV